MVAKAGGYFIPPFKGYHGVTQCDPFSPIIFNVVVDSVIRHWVELVAPMEAGAEGIEEKIQKLVDFYMRVVV